MSGWIPSTTTDQRPISQESLNNSTLSITASGTLDSGEKFERRRPFTVPLRTAVFGSHGEAHLAIRDRKGKHVDYLTPGLNDILTDGLFPSFFVKNGTYTFEITGRLGDQHDGRRGTCLFSISMTQRLEGKDSPW